MGLGLLVSHSEYRGYGANFLEGRGVMGLKRGLGCQVDRVCMSGGFFEVSDVEFEVRGRRER